VLLNRKKADPEGKKRGQVKPWPLREEGDPHSPRKKKGIAKKKERRRVRAMRGEKREGPSLLSRRSEAVRGEGSVVREGGGGGGDFLIALGGEGDPQRGSGSPEEHRRIQFIYL